MFEKAAFSQQIDFFIFYSILRLLPCTAVPLGKGIPVRAALREKFIYRPG
jgi:hypothetical protein